MQVYAETGNITRWNITTVFYGMLIFTKSSVLNGKAERTNKDE